jgi:hypothetical protein
MKIFLLGCPIDSIIICIQLLSLTFEIKNKLGQKVNKTKQS